MRPLGDTLVSRVLNGPSAHDVQDLLTEFSAGYPMLNLTRLLRSGDDQVVKVAVWMASELGELAHPILPDVQRLLGHHLPYVRGFALDTILLAASPNDGDVLADAVCRIDDEDEGVRWKAIHFLARATTPQLRAAVKHCNQLQLAAVVRWLLAVSAESKTDEIVQRIDAGESTSRLVAAAAAARVSSRSMVPLLRASRSENSEIQSFARQWLEIERS